MTNQAGPGKPAVAKTFPAVTLARANAILTAPGAPFEMEEQVIRGVPTRVWKNAPPTLRDLFLLSRKFGERTFVVYGDERVSYEEFARAALVVANALQAGGLQKGDRVAIAMRNLPEWPAAFFGCLLAGGIATLLNAWWTGPELEYGLDDSGARFAFVDRERLERISGHLQKCATLERVFVTRANEDVAHPKVVTLESILGDVKSWRLLSDRPLPAVPLDPEDDATILYTSGTTGKPKGAVGTHRNTCTSVLIRPYLQARSFLRRGEPIPAPDPNAPPKSALLVVPLFHVTGCQASMIPLLAIGGKLVLMHKWDPELALQLIERERITGAGGVPTIAWQLVEHPALGKYDLSSLEGISYGGAPAAAELTRRVKDAFPRAAPGTGWGMTEVSGAFTGCQAEDYLARPDSCGPAIPVGDMKITDAVGDALPAGSVGELWVKGPNVVRGYWRNPKATAETFVDGWLRTGDIAKLDDEGFCYILDRAKDMLIRGGENIYCIEVESALYDHPAVIDAAVVAVAHRTLGEEPGAVVTLKEGEGVSEEELRAFVAQRLAAFKVPVKIVFSAEMLPRNATGKVRKNELKQLFAESTLAVG
ncbi:MAG TPA: class I adenylate-forming enzyme family protein [Xanthobacteraceae bacterium]|jgi:long-chain acyl-CoA synthetase